MLDPPNHESKLPQVRPATIITDDDPVSVGSFPSSPAMPLPSSVTGPASNVSSEVKKAPCQKVVIAMRLGWYTGSFMFICLVKLYQFVW